MLKQKIKKGFLQKEDIWFSENPTFQLFRSYIQSPVMKDIPGMKRSHFYTIFIDLSNDEEFLLSEMDKGTSYEIRRAKKEGIQFKAGGDLSEFVDFFNLFASSKGIEGTSLNYVQFEPQMRITKAYLGEEILVMHSYVEDERRGRLCMSASRVTKADDPKKDRALIGYANRFLHFQDMLMFKSEGKAIYDFGGYAKGTEDQALSGINQFKINFGGKIVEEFNYRPVLLP
jgi:hypothetical protein